MLHLTAQKFNMLRETEVPSIQQYLNTKLINKHTKYEYILS